MKKIISASIILVIPILAFAQSNVSSSDTTTKKQSAPVSKLLRPQVQKEPSFRSNVQPKSAAEQIRSGMQPGATSTNPGTTAKQPASAVELYEQTHQNNGTTPH